MKKIKLEAAKREEELKDTKSPYYAGSAALLSLYMTVSAIEYTSLDFKDAFPDLKELLLTLYEEDPQLFALSKKKEIFSLEDWNFLTQAMNDYADLFFKLGELMHFCKESMKENYLPSLEKDNQFLAAIAKDNISSFEGKEDATPEYKRAVNDVLSNLARSW